MQAQARLKMIAKMKPITTPQEAALRAFTFPEPEEMSPPIIHIEGGITGYGGNEILKRLNLRIDQDDRIALLGKNGQGKSTLSKLLADRLPLMAGKMTRSSKLRIGYFAQHQVDELYVDETPLDHLRRLRPDEAPAKWRARLAGFGLAAAQAETEVGRLSGGQKARLSLLIATIDAPHMLILDEPTNHLDIESREALVEALTAYSGAVILVSHDMHLLSLVADRLWLVSDGTVKPYDGDLESYRALLLAREKPAAKTGAAKPAKPKRASRDVLIALRADVRKSEARVEKLSEMREKLDEKLADPNLYEPGKAADMAVWQKKHAECIEALERARRPVDGGAGETGAGRGPMIDTAFLITSFVTLFVIVDPIGLTPVFIALTQGMPSARRRSIALRATITAAVLLAVFAALGEAVLGFIGISMPAFRVAGGALLFLTALDMLFERRNKRREDRSEEDDFDDPSVFPLAIPLMAGPGSIATVILLTGQQPGFTGFAMVMGVVIAVLAILLVMCLFSGLFERMLGKTGITVVTRLLGMLLAALSVQFVLDGLRAFGFAG